MTRKDLSVIADAANKRYFEYVDLVEEEVEAVRHRHAYKIQLLKSERDKALEDLREKRRSEDIEETMSRMKIPEGTLMAEWSTRDHGRNKIPAFKTGRMGILRVVRQSKEYIGHPTVGGLVVALLRKDGQEGKKAVRYSGKETDQLYWVPGN